MWEIESAVNLILHIMKLSKQVIVDKELKAFKSILLSTLTDRYCLENWNPKNPALGSKLRSLKISLVISNRIRIAFEEAEICEWIFRNSFPITFEVYPNPNSVSFKIGEKGPECYLVNDKGPKFPWEPTDIYSQLAAIAYSNNNSINCNEMAHHYIAYKSRYQPWDGRKLEIDYDPINIDGSRNTLNDDWDYFPYEDKLPDIVLQEEVRHIYNFTDFSKWFRKGGDFETDVTQKDIIKEFLNHLNGEKASEYFQRMSCYKENKKYYDCLFEQRKYEPNNNRYWITYTHKKRLNYYKD